MQCESSTIQCSQIGGILLLQIVHEMRNERVLIFRLMAQERSRSIDVDIGADSPPSYTPLIDDRAVINPYGLMIQDLSSARAHRRLDRRAILQNCDIIQNDCRLNENPLAKWLAFVFKICNY